MLDRAKVIQEFMRVKDRLFVNDSYNVNLLYEVWKKIGNDSAFATSLSKLCARNLLPGWIGNVTDAFPIANDSECYSIIGCDGSQIYPDRHGPVNQCFVINIGTVIIEYKAASSTVKLYSEPHVILFEDIESLFNNVIISKDLVDCTREEYELRRLFEVATQFDSSTTLLALVDGSLLFWHLEGKNSLVRSFFFDEYIKVLENFYRSERLIAGYISAPRSKELISLTAYAYTLCDEYDDGSGGILFNHCSDSILMRHFVPVGYRSTLFWTNSPIVQEYPAYVRPYFFYINCGMEIARVEIPQWIATNPSYINRIATLIYDQTVKGYGYPVVLAEAHEQAVVKSADRDFFYTLFCKASIEQKRTINVSQKSLKKQRMSI